MLKDIFITKNKSINEAVQILDKIGLRIVLVVDTNRRFLGTVTDDDVRRALLRGHSFEKPVFSIMNKNPLYANNRNNARQILRSSGASLIPIVDKNLNVIDLETIDCTCELVKDMSVVLMAGGFGKRMIPLTDILPKPLLPLGQETIIDHVFNNLKGFNFRKVYITLHYKGNLIKKHFEKKVLNTWNIEFIDEKKPLGTAGSLYLLKNKIDANFIVINSDILTKINFINLVHFHSVNGSIATICTKKYTHRVPFGVVSTDDIVVSNIIEKPQFAYFINAGIYCFHAATLDLMEKEEYLEMPEFLLRVMSKGGKVCSYPLYEDWTDLGSIVDYKNFSKRLQIPVWGSKRKPQIFPKIFK